MTDDDWEVERGTGKSGGATSGTAGRSRRTKPGSRSANVVPFPGNWFGSVEDLVPVHPEQDSSEPAVPVVELRAEQVSDANAFWEGEAAPLQDVVSEPSGPGSSPSSALPAESAGGAEAAGGRRRLALALTALLFALVATGAALVVQALPGGSAQGARHAGLTAGRDNASAITQTVQSTVTVTTKARTTSSHTRKHDRRVHKATPGSLATTATKTPPAYQGSTGAVSSSGSTSRQVSNGTGPGCATQSPDSGCLP